MTNQTSFEVDTRLGAGNERKLTGGYYRPPITPMGISTVDRVEYAQNKATGLPGWNLHLAAKPGAGAVTVWFARDETNLTLFCDNHNIKLPTVGKLTCNWRLEWHKAGYQNVIDALEMLPQEDTAVNTAPAEPTTSEQLNDTLNIKRSSITVDQKTSARFMAVVGEIADHFNVPGKGRAELWHALLEVDSLNDWHGSFDEAVDKLRLAIIDTNYAPKAKVKDFIANLFRNANRTVNFQSATGYDTYEDALAEERPSEIIAEVRDYLSKSAATPPAPSPAPEAPPAGATASGASGTPETVARAANTPSSPKKDGSTVSDAKDEIRAKYTKKLQGGKEYLEVQGRVLLFRLDHSDWALETDLIGMTEDAAVFKCTIRNADGRIISTGHGRATAAGTKNLGSRFIEKAETAAIGRALSLASYGTDDTLEDSDYLADAPRAA